MNIEISPKEYEKQLNWDDAMMYCQLLTIDNKNDWRLPTKNELYTIYESSNDFVRGNYWSSDESDITGAWFVNFNNGIQYRMSKHIINYRARPIRNIRPLEKI
jgi:hypothetical protein